MAASHKLSLSARGIIKICCSGIGFARNYSKHYNPKFRALRRKKFEIAKPNWNLTEEDKELYSKKMAGLTPSSHSSDIPYYVSSTYDIIDPYVPKDGDAKYTSLLEKASGSVASFTTQLAKNKFHSQKIRNFDQDFSMKRFAHQAKEIYIQAHEALASKNMNELLKNVTEKAYNLMTANFKYTTIRWKYIESLDPPSTVHVRTADLATKGNVFGQATVRFHSKQMLAIYDRFGRLMYGSEILAKDVIEYVVFEKHLPNVYGSWKMHDKIIPDGMPPRDPVFKTYRLIEDQSTEEIIDEEVQLRNDILPVSEEEAKAEAKAEFEAKAEAKSEFEAKDVKK